MLTRMFFICVGVLLVAQTPVHAYTDPGSGTLIWQMLLAASFGVMFYLRRIIGWLHGLKARNQKTKSAKTLSAETEEERGQVV